MLPVSLALWQSTYSRTAPSSCAPGCATPTTQRPKVCRVYNRWSVRTSSQAPALKVQGAKVVFPDLEKPETIAPALEGA